MQEKKERFLDRVIRELCEEMNIKLENLCSGWVLQLSKNGKVRHITRNHFDSNPHSSSEIADDKNATYEVLKSQKVPAIKHMILFRPTTKNTYISDKVRFCYEKEFEKYKCLVVKPNCGCEGKEIELCYEKEQVNKSIQKLFQTYRAISICPYYNIEAEYRVFYLKEKVHLIYKKTKPFIIGDGKSTIKELVSKLCLPYNKIVENNLKKLNMDEIPRKGEKIEISWKHNLTGGAMPTILPKGEKYDKIANLAIQAGKALNINFATIDIVQTIDHKWYVMEVNAGICAELFSERIPSSYETIKDIYRKALIAMFE